MECKNCGIILQEDEKICPSCGKEVEGLNIISEEVRETEIISQDTKKETGNTKNLIIMFASCIIIVVLCFVGYMYATKTLLFKETDKNTKISDEPIIKESDYPRWDTSTATQPLALAFYKDFTGNKDAKITDFKLSKTHEAYVKLINDELDFIIVAGPSDDALALAKQKGVELEITPVVHEAFVFFASTENGVDSLTQEQVVGIYTGKIKNWKEVGGADKEIKAFQRPENSGSQTGMLDLVMKGTKMMEPVSEEYSLGTMAGIVNAVSSYGGEVDGIGYSYYYYVATMYEDIDKDIADGIKLLAIDGIKPEKTSIQNNTYAYTTSYYVVTVKGRVSENTKKVVDEMFSTRGQKIAEGVKYVPVK